MTMLLLFPATFLHAMTVNLKAYILTPILLTWTIWRTPTNASKWRMGFNSAFKGLNKKDQSTFQNEAYNTRKFQCTFNIQLLNPKKSSNRNKNITFTSCNSFSKCVGDVPNTKFEFIQFQTLQVQRFKFSLQFSDTSHLQNITGIHRSQLQ